LNNFFNILYSDKPFCRREWSKFMTSNKKSVFTASLIIFFGLSNYAQAAPSISGVSGSVSNANSVVISGGGFGVKSPAAPLIWDNFEGGVSGTPLFNDPRWPSYRGAPESAYYTDVLPYSGTLSVYNWVTGPDAPVKSTLGSFWTNNFFFDPTDTIYYSYMSRYVATGEPHPVTGKPDIVYKNGRTNAYPNKYSGPGAVKLSHRMAIYNPGTGDIVVGDDITVDSPLWHRHEIYKRNSDPGVPNGEFWVSIRDGEQVRHLVNAVTRLAGYTFQQTNIILGVMLANPASDGDHKAWVDDVYVDNTRARVEICEGSTWAARTRCDIQIPSAWSNNSITFSANQGAFTSGQNAYLYVVDSTGAVNASGYPITIGGSSSASIPGDINKDGVVNIFDYNIFLQNFGVTNDCQNAADLNGDCSVNIFDYNVLLQNFGRTS
jgi:hypothetical protein